MNKKEISEIRCHIRQDRSSMNAVYGCYVNESGEIVSQFRRSIAMMSENEREKYFSVFKKAMYGEIGKRLIDLTFATSQVADSEEHYARLAKLRETALEDEETLTALYTDIIESKPLETAYLILLGYDTYDVPFKNKKGDADADASEEVFRFILCSICPVKPTKPTLHYVPEEKEFHDGGIINVAAAPELGFLFPAFDDRATNVYNALFFTHSPKKNYGSFISAVFNTAVPLPAEAQKASFQSVLSEALEGECSLEVAQAVHKDLRDKIELHKEAKISEPLLISKSDVAKALSACGVEEAGIEKFRNKYDETFGADTELHPQNLVGGKIFEIRTPETTLHVKQEDADKIQTRVIGGIKYILIPAEEEITVNGMPIQITNET